LVKDRVMRPQSADALSRALEECRDAHAWSDGDAEAWWAGASSSEIKLTVTPTAEQPQRTICCDFERRLASRESPAR
jgi:hypothetical protein